MRRRGPERHSDLVVSTTFQLVRHAACEQMVDTLVGRGIDVPLTSVGQQQARALAARLSREPPPVVIYCSPRRRTRETAQAIADATGAGIVLHDAFDEIDFGGWTGQAFMALQNEAAWQQWNSARSTARAPGGESMVEAQARALAGIEALVPQHTARHVVIVSHAEIIRAVLLHHLGLSLDAYCRLEVSPASRSIVELAPWGAKVLAMNERSPP